MLPAKQEQLWRFALAGLDRGIPVLLLYVVESKGSSPGRQGFFLVIDAAGQKEGSIGGGIMEHKFIELAKEYLLQKTPVSLLRRQVHDKESAKDQSGMICSGEQTILIYSLRPQDKTPIQNLLATSPNGCLQFSPQGMSFDPQPPEQTAFFQRSADTDWIYRERTGYIHRLYIIGGGHVALAFSRLMPTMDFYVTLFDDRDDLDSFRRNQYVQEKKCIDDYTRLTEIISGGPDTFVVAM